jgi:hypothetical protein
VPQINQSTDSHKTKLHAYKSNHQPGDHFNCICIQTCNLRKKKLWKTLNLIIQTFETIGKSWILSLSAINIELKHSGKAES